MSFEIKTPETGENSRLEQLKQEALERLQGFRRSLEFHQKMIMEGKATEDELELLSKGADAAREMFKGVLDLKHTAKKEGGSK